LTTSIAATISTLLGLSPSNKPLEIIIRAAFFGLNLFFNGVMWGLFTMALARGSSATKVSIVNTSANFMVTAVLGWAIFSERLPAMWFLGAVCLVAGNVVIGSRDNKTEAESVDIEGEAIRLEDESPRVARNRYTDDVPDIDGDSEHDL
jgi:drug/metabolite transporter (DMT)-like permease